VEQQIAPAYIDLVPGLIATKAEQLQKNVTGRSPPVTLMRDALNDDGLGRDAAIRGSCRTMRDA
jgi:hypothetical protein